MCKVLEPNIINDECDEKLQATLKVRDLRNESQ